MITGISGFVGSHLAEYLSRSGWNVTGYDLRAPRLKCDFYSGDLSDRSTLEAALRKSAPDVIFHLAGILKSTTYKDYYKAHVSGLPVICIRTFNLLGPGPSPDMTCSSFARQIAFAEKAGNLAAISA